MVRRVSELAKARANFAFETTMASRSFAPFLARCRSNGYLVSIAYVFLDSPHLAVQRVRERVAAGGHHVARVDIIRRYHAGRRNFLKLYLPLADHWYAFNNSGESPALIACDNHDGAVAVHDANSGN
jgi:predicted ABC-type ATPase